MIQQNDTLETIKVFVKEELNQMELENLYSETACERLYNSIHREGLNLYKTALLMVAELFNETNRAIHA
jgi:hypothetical protein